MKKKNIYIVITILVFISLQIPNFFNNIRYKIESTFGEPNSFFHSVGIGIMKEHRIITLRNLTLRILRK